LCLFSAPSRAATGGLQERPPVLAVSGTVRAGGQFRQRQHYGEASSPATNAPEHGFGFEYHAALIVTAAPPTAQPCTATRSAAGSARQPAAKVD
jgi:hypothetical protein